MLYTYFTPFVEPKSLHHSPSNTTSEEVKSRSTTGDVYDHWFALCMYELKNYLANNPIQLRNGDQSTLNLPFKGKTVAIQVFHLKEIIIRWKQMEKFLYEECSTAALAVGLERFLFPTNAGILPDGVCCHQMPISDGSRVKSNFSVFPYPVGRSFRYGRRMLEQNTFVAVSNFKKSDFDQSKNESFAYSLAQQQGNTTLVRLLFPMTKHRVMLQIYVPISGSVLLINIFDDDTSEANLAQFFCMLYVGVKYLLHSPIKSTMAPHPIDDDELKLNYYAKHTNPRVLISEDNFFYKLYDTVRNKPQLEVAKLVLRDATVEQLSDDGRYCYLKYKYQEDDENPDLNSFQKILNQLHEIHEEGYVHSDIRRQNIVLGKHSACIIDFDLAEKEGVNYPLTYNSSPKIKERHPKAEAGLPREKIHDVHALDVIMRIYNFSGIMEQYRSGKSLLEIATNITEDMEM